MKILSEFVFWILSILALIAIGSAYFLIYSALLLDKPQPGYIELRESDWKCVEYMDFDTPDLEVSGKRNFLVVKPKKIHHRECIKYRAKTP